MNRPSNLVLNVWQEVCRHIEITECAGTVSKLLATKLPAGKLIVRRIDRQLLRVENVAVSPGREARELEQRDVRLDSDEMQRLLRWCRRGEVKLRKAGDRARHVAFSAIGSAWTGDVLVGPLVSEHGTFGLILLEAMPSQQFMAAHKPVLQQVLEPLAVALENDHRLRELKALREAAESDRRSLLARLGRDDLAETIIGIDGGLKAVMERVELVARSDVPVLILGETGSGKEVIARAIHNRSPSAEGPFIRVNCGAIPPELIDSELFGHEKGSFTGAASARRGWFERADEGTLFLDEIGELPLAAQVRLLRVLQDGLFERVGGEEPVKVQVRIVAATHRDLAGMVRTGAFREDLWYRLAVFPIVLPPLHERLEDIPALAEHFAHRAARRFGLTPQSPTPGDIALLMSYRWPGNIRELGSVMDRAAILGEGARLDLAAALGPVAGTDQPGSRAENATLPAPIVHPASVIPLDAAMKQHIERALLATQGRVEGPQGAAKLLEINPHTLRARMRKLGIQWAAIRQARSDPPGDYVI